MAISSKRKEDNKQKKIEELKKELVNNDEILRKNTEEPRVQIQVALHRLGYPPGSPMFDVLLDKFKVEIEELNLMIDSGMKMVNPSYQYQQSREWELNQVKRIRIELGTRYRNVEEIERNVEKVTQEIAIQTERLIIRRKQIIEQLEELGVDVSEFKKDTPPDYIA